MTTHLDIWGTPLAVGDRVKWLHQQKSRIDIIDGVVLRVTAKWCVIAPDYKPYGAERMAAPRWLVKKPPC